MIRWLINWLERHSPPRVTSFSENLEALSTGSPCSSTELKDRIKKAGEKHQRDNYVADAQIFFKISKIDACLLYEDSKSGVFPLAK